MSLPQIASKTVAWKAPQSPHAGSSTAPAPVLQRIFRAGCYVYIIGDFAVKITLVVLSAMLAIALPTFAKSLQLKDLPAAVQKTVQDTLKGAEIKNISKEVEKGVTQYEVESLLNGKHRDFNVDGKGKLIVVEEEVALDSIPAAAQAAIEKKAAGGKLGMVETVTKDGVVLYEAAFTSKAGKKGAVLVKADGTETKD
jgi:hypothetical protein